MRDRMDYMQKSDALVKQERWDAQTELMREALTLFPDDAEFCLRYATSLVTSSPEKAVVYLQRAAGLAGSDPSQLVRCASLMVRLGEFSDAKSCIDRAAPHVDSEFALIADMFHVIGLLAVEAGDADVAGRYLRLACEVEPETIGHAFRYAEFLANMGRAEQALDILSRGLEHGAPERERLLQLREQISRM